MPTSPLSHSSLANFEAYARQVCLYYNGREHAELKQLRCELGRILGTKNQSETVLRALRRMSECEVAVERLFRTSPPCRAGSGRDTDSSLQCPVGILHGG